MKSEESALVASYMQENEKLKKQHKGHRRFDEIKAKSAFDADLLMELPLQCLHFLISIPGGL